MSNPLDDIDAKFRSANSIPVSRASVTREEWEALKSYIIDLNADHFGIGYGVARKMLESTGEQ